MPGTSRSYQLEGNVALLTRNIKIIGQEYPEMNTQSYGARVLVGTFFSGGINFRGINFIQFLIKFIQFYNILEIQAGQIIHKTIRLIHLEEIKIILFLFYCFVVLNKNKSSEDLYLKLFMSI